MAAKVITSKNDLKNLLSTELSGKNIGILTVATSSFRENNFSKLYPCALYCLIKMKQVVDYTFSMPYMVNNYSGVETFSETVKLVNENLSDYISDYVYIDPDQFNYFAGETPPDTMNLPSDSHWLINNPCYTNQILDRYFQIFSPFFDMREYCNITKFSYFQNFYNTAFGKNLKNHPYLKVVNPNLRTLYIPQFPFFDRNMRNPPVSPKNERFILISESVDVDNDSLETIEKKISEINPYYEIVNLNGSPATIDDIRNREAMVVLYDDSEMWLRADGHFSGSLMWLGAKKTDAYELWPDRGWKTLFDDEIDSVIEAKWTNPQQSDRDLFRSDMIQYYRSRFGG